MTPSQLKEKLEQATGFIIPSHRWPDLLRQCQQYTSFDTQIALTAVGKTSFFRDRPWFLGLETQVMRELLTGTKPWTLWSAGCSTGEETYSLASLAQLALCPQKAEIEILGTDLVGTRLKTARKGLYSAPSLRTWPEHYQCLFRKEADQWQYKGPIPCRFEQHNLALDQPKRSCKGSWDLILCRNVLIYFSPELIRQTLLKFHEVLSPKGWLVTSPAETLLEHQDLFEVRLSKDAFFFQKRSSLRGKVRG
jgi:chemotaxis protein methyltransferase CheR